MAAARQFCGWLMYTLLVATRSECNYVASDAGDGTPYWGSAKAPGYCFGATSDNTYSYKYICESSTQLTYRVYSASQTCDDSTIYADYDYSNIASVLWNCGGEHCVLQYRQYTWDCMDTNCPDEDSCNINSADVSWYEEAGIPGKCTTYQGGTSSVFISCNSGSNAISTSSYSCANCACSATYSVTYGSRSCATPGLYYDVSVRSLGGPVPPTTPRPTTTTAIPSVSPTDPSTPPSAAPTSPTSSPTTAAPTGPTAPPTMRPTRSPTVPTESPTDAPTAMVTTTVDPQGTSAAAPRAIFAVVVVLYSIVVSACLLLC